MWLGGEVDPKPDQTQCRLDKGKRVSLKQNNDDGATQKLQDEQAAASQSCAQEA